MKNIPQKLFLVIDDEHEVKDFNDLDHEFVCWCQERTGELDIEYELANQDKWISVEEKQPLCYRAGNWDGKASDLVISQDEKGQYHLCRCYEFRGEYEWYDNNDFGLRHEVVKWKNIE